MTDVLVCAIPVLDLQYPPSSPAVIKACLQRNGYTANTIDFNLELFEICVQYGADHTEVQNVMQSSAFDKDADTFVGSLFNQHKDILDKWLTHCIDHIKTVNPRVVGVSVFSYYSHKSALALLHTIRERCPQVKIMLGGRGLSSMPFGPSYKQFEKFFNHIEEAKDFGDMAQSVGLADYLIYNDGEQAVIDCMSNEARITAGDIETLDLNKIPFVDYDDYKIQNYQWVNEPILAITGSKGCVRQCSFCDIPVLWPKYKWREGKHIASEMIYLKNKHGIKKFYLTDSLVNGSMKAFTDFITSVAQWNSAMEERLSWVGQYITRPKQQMPQGYYQLLKDSGAEGLTIGIESGSDRVRDHMKKKFSTEDIYTELDNFQKHDISCVLLFFCSYPTETWQDYLDTVNMLINLQQYCASNTVYKITLGIPYTHHANTGLWNMQEEIGLDYDPKNEVMWLLKTNAELTLWERMRRRLISQEVCDVLNLPLSRNSEELQQMISTMHTDEEKLLEYFGTKLKDVLYTDRYNLTEYDQILMPYDVQDQLYEYMRSGKGQNTTQIMHTMSHVQTDNIGTDKKYYTQLRSMIIET